MMLETRLPAADREFVERSRRENLFWLRIMKEHALFLSEGLGRRNANAVRTANTLFSDFDALLQSARATGPAVAQVRSLNERAIALTRDLRNFKQDLLFDILTGRIEGNFNFPLLIDHVRREAEYFITVLTRLNEGITEPVPAAIVRENVFWLRIMADHSKFIRNLLDPSERKLIAAADQFSDQFDTLLAQARDLESMVQGLSPVLVFCGGHTLDRCTLIRLREAEERRLEATPPVLVRLTGEAQAAAREIRDFKRQATQLVADVRGLSIINPLLADHVTREAEKFLEVLSMLEARIAQQHPAPAAARVIARPAAACPE